MSLPLVFPYSTGQSLGIAPLRMADFLRYDFADLTFKASPTTPVLAVTEFTGIWAGTYGLNLTTDPAVWTNGDYVLSVHNMASANVRVFDAGLIPVQMFNGSAATVFPAQSGTDPLGVAVPGGYSAGTLGYLAGTYLPYLASLLRPEDGTVVSADGPAKTITVSGVPGVPGQYLGRKMRVDLAAGGDMLTGFCTAESGNDTSRTFTFPALTAVPAASDRVWIL